MSTLPLVGFIVALEAWANGRPTDRPRAWLLARTPVGSFELWHGAGFDGRIVAAAAAGAHAQLSIPDPTLERSAQTWTREDAVKVFVARTIKAAIGGQDGWHPAYHGSLILHGLGANRFEAASRFREFAPAGEAPVAQPADVSFDPNDFQARLRARRARVAAVAQVQADLRVEHEEGARRVKAFRAPSDTMLADVPVVGLSESGPSIPGHVYSCNPAFAVVEVALTDLDRVAGPLTWVFDPSHPFTVGVTAADHR